MNEGIYEAMINQVIKSKIDDLDKETFYIKESPVDKEEAALLLSQYLSLVLKRALGLFPKDGALDKQLDLANKIILLIRDELKNEEFEEDILDVEGKILKAIYSKINTDFTDIDQRLLEITPYTRLIHSELFTGGNARTSLDGELKKAIGVLKKRLSDFEKTIRELTISSKGITVSEPLKNLRGLLSGVPQKIDG